MSTQSGLDCISTPAPWRAYPHLRRDSRPGPHLRASGTGHHANWESGSARARLSGNEIGRPGSEYHTLCLDAEMNDVRPLGSAPLDFWCATSALAEFYLLIARR